MLSTKWFSKIQQSAYYWIYKRLKTKILLILIKDNVYSSIQLRVLLLSKLKKDNIYIYKKKLLYL